AQMLFAGDMGPEDERPQIEKGDYLRCPLLEVESCFDRIALAAAGAPPLGHSLPRAPELSVEEAGEAADQGAPKTPHGSFAGFFERHGSSDAWKESVWEEYLTQPAVLLPVSLAISAVVIS